MTAISVRSAYTSAIIYTHNAQRFTSHSLNCSDHNPPLFPTLNISEKARTRPQPTKQFEPRKHNFPQNNLLLNIKYFGSSHAFYIWFASLPIHLHRTLPDSKECHTTRARTSRSRAPICRRSKIFTAYFFCDLRWVHTFTAENFPTPI